MDYKKRKRLRILGKLLFILYIGFIIYFLLFSDWYGRSIEGMQEYHYNPYNYIVANWIEQEFPYTEKIETEYMTLYIRRN